MHICLANRLETQADVRAEVLCDRLKHDTIPFMSQFISGDNYVHFFLTMKLKMFPVSRLAIVFGHSRYLFPAKVNP